MNISKILSTQFDLWPRALLYVYLDSCRVRSLQGLLHFSRRLDQRSDKVDERSCAGVLRQRMASGQPLQVRLNEVFVAAVSPGVTLSFSL
ncbi:hypothetical protein J6590_052982 [Homalodisca vitripennis]|nr:hypothetical protein J6590_052982 [Homalodisca vitripennis]